MDQNGNAKNPGETNNNKVPNDHHATAPGKMILTPGSPNDNLNLSWTSSSSTSHYESSTNATPDKVHNSNNMARITVYP